MAWTTPSTWASGDWNLQIRDNMNWLYYDLVPAGTIVMHASTSALSGWLPCDGRLISNVAPYERLYAILPPAKTIPDLRDRFVVGSGGSLYSPYSTGGFNSLSHLHNINSLTVSSAAPNANSSDHNHSLDVNGHNHAFQPADGRGAAIGTGFSAAYNGHAHGFVGSTHNHAVTTLGGHGHSINAHNHSTSGATTNTSLENRPPYFAVIFMIKY